MRSRVQRLLRDAERGSMDAGSFGDIIYIPFLITLLLIGLMFAMVGFWRVGASYATQISTQVGSVAEDQGNGVLALLWQRWTGSDDLWGGFSSDPDARTVQADISGQKTFNSTLFGPVTFSVGAGGNMHVRAERFYPGQP